jgi:glutamate dehydrogenase (NAD(P)+)
VGAAAAARLVELGAVVVGISTSRGALHDPDGLDVAELLAVRERHGDALIEHVVQPNARRMHAGEELLLDADVLVPAATQDVVDAALARDLRFRVIVEGANLPITLGAQRLLAARNITVVPDFIANAGGVVAAAYAMDARRSPFPVERSVIFSALSEKIRSNALVVLDEVDRTGETSHDAARRLAADRVQNAMRLKRRVREAVLA